MIDLGQEYQSLWIEMIEINRKYEYGLLERSSEDQERWMVLFTRQKEISDAFNAANPVENCPSCNHKRYASLGGKCLMFGKCSEAIGVGG